MHQSLTMICPHCDAKLRIKPEKIGKSATCPGCQQSITISVPEAPAAPAAPAKFATSDLPATEKQKQYALSLGCEFPDSITRGEISELIELGKEKQQEAQWEKMNSLRDREQGLVEEIRAELLAEMADDPQVSAATPRQMVDSLDEREQCAVLITVPFDEIESYQDLRGVSLSVSSSNEMTSEDTAHLLMAVALNYYKKLGLLPAEG